MYAEFTAICGFRHPLGYYNVSPIDKRGLLFWFGKRLSYPDTVVTVLVAQLCLTLVTPWTIAL